MIWSTIVKTEQLAILFGVMSMLFVLQGFEKKPGLLFVAGVLAAFAFYVRQPTLYLPMATVLFLLISRQHFFKNLLLNGLGYLFVTLVVFLFYVPAMGLEDVLFSQLNPLNLIWNRVMHLFGWLPEQYRIVDNAGFRVLDQDMNYTLNSWYHALAFALFIVLAALAAVFSKNIAKETRQQKMRLLLYCWLGFVFLLYFYQAASRGFYTQYFTEALPPLILLAAPVILKVIDKIYLPKTCIVLLSLGSFFGIYFVQRLFWHISLGMVGYVVLSIGLAFLVFFYAMKNTVTFGRMLFSVFLPVLASAAAAVLFKRLGMHNLFRFILVLATFAATLYALNLFLKAKLQSTIILVLAGFFYAAFYSGHIMGPRYEAIWSRKTLTEVADYLKQNSQQSDQVLSGGTIWTFESGLQPYLNVPHPTEFFKHKYANFEAMLQNKPPQYIILDGYTKRKFARYWPFIQEQLQMRYERVKTSGGSKYVVEVFRIKPDAHDNSSFITRIGVQP